MKEVAWFLYLLEADDGRATYVGVSTDPQQRLRAHNGEIARGARTTRRGRPWKILGWWGPYLGRGSAQAAEACLKAMPAAGRRALADGQILSQQPWDCPDFLP